MADGCALGPIGCGVVDTIGGVVGGAVQVVSFANDPLGYVLSKIQEATAGLAGTVLPALVNALNPDFSASWWIQCYEASFGIAVLVFVILIIVTLAQAGRHEMGGREAFESIFLYGPLFLGGAVFGPLIGATFSAVVSVATDGVTAWGLGTTQTQFLAILSARFASKDVAGITGGAVAGIIVMLVILLALIGAILICIVQLATVYLSAALIPLGIVWLLHPITRSFAKKAPLVVIGIIASHFFLFLMLAFGFFAISALGLSWADPTSTAQQNGLVVLVNLATVGVIMGLVVFAPMGLLALTKAVSPLGGAGHASSGGFNAPGGSSPRPSSDPSGGNKGGDSDGQSQLTEVANDQSAGQSTTGAETPGNTDVSSSTPGPSTSAGTPGAPSTAAASESGAAAAASSTEAAGATGTAGAAGAAGATGAAEGVAAAGAAESATGVGAAIGVPTLIAAAALSAASKGAQMAESTAGHAAEAGQD